MSITRAMRAALVMMAGAALGLPGAAGAASTAAPDPCAAAETITNADGQVGGFGFAPRVWYRWTAASSGQASFGLRTGEAATQPVIRVHAGTCAAPGPDLAQPVSETEAQYAAVTFAAEKGASYAIAVSDAALASDHYALTWPAGGRPTHDTLDNAAKLAGFSGDVVGDMSFATTNFPQGEESCEGEAGGTSVWYQWTAPLSDYVLADIDDRGLSGGGVTACVFEGSRYPLTKVSDTTRFDWGSAQVSWLARQGVNYRIRIDRFGPSSSGLYELGWMYAN